MAGSTGGGNPQRHAGGGGFALVEILVCVAIISVLAGILVPVLSVARRRGYDAENISNLRQLYAAAEIYSQDEGALPASVVFLIPRYCSAPSIASSRNDPFPEGFAIHGYEPQNIYSWYAPKYKVTFGGALEFSLTPYALQHEAKDPSAPRGLFADVTPLQNITSDAESPPPFSGRYRRLTEDGAAIMLPSPAIHKPGYSCVSPWWFLIDVSYADRIKICEDNGP